MANITSYDFFAYTHDTLDAGITGLAVTQNPIDLTDTASVSGISVQTDEPTGSSVYWVFNAGDGWFSLSSQGYAQVFSNDIPDAETVQSNGNTTAELQALTDIPAFVNKKVNIAIALISDDGVSFPKVRGFSVNAKVADTKTELELLSQEYSLGTNKIIVSCTAEKTEQGTGKAEITARVLRPSGIYSEWMSFDDIAMQEGTSVQFKAVLSVTSPDTGTAALRNVECVYANLIQGSIDTDSKTITTNTENWYIAIRQGRLMLKHEPLDEGSTITPYLALRKLPESIDSHILGTGTGERAQYELPQKSGIDIHSIKLFIDGSRVYTGYEVNTATGKLTCTAPSGAMITVSYEYGIEPETWQEMQEVSSWEMPEYTQTEYRYAVPEDEESKGICAVKIVLHSESGESDSESIGTGTGYQQTYRLKHSPSDATVKLFADGTEIQGTYIGNRLVQTAAAEGKALTAKYNWTSEPPVITQITAVFSE